MAWDARSRERLEQLGRQLPQPLPQPEAGATRAKAASGGVGKSHRVETETDPKALFRELMQASPDGHVPPHLLQRLRELEHAPPEISHPSPSTPSTKAAISAKTGMARMAQSRQQDPLYVSFEQMLLEDESL
ncbi:MAG: hypothetical protein RLZZ336_340 [Cyanobacteriota bacterium]|jgi:hypothetical protein